ncbi:MAG: hypothetical protein RBU21_21135 [FCB group bacterium]|jgi:hypothetical protein|nr:hypothetical protein [FCB group bacterium]
MNILNDSQRQLHCPIGDNQFPVNVPRQSSRQGGNEIRFVTFTPSFSYLLYAMMLLGFIGIFVAKPYLNMPALTGWQPLNPLTNSNDPLLLNAGKDRDLFFFRDSQGLEVDLLLASGRKLIPIEIKAAHTPHHDLSRGVERFSTLTQEAQHPTVIYAGRNIPSQATPSFLNFKDTTQFIRNCH